MMRTPVLALERSGELLDRLRVERPLVQCLTNTVTTNFVANVLLATGASPAMVDIPVEASAMARSAGAVLVNLGTPRAEQRDAMAEAAAAAYDAGTPWVLDPVGVGALPVRTTLAERLLGLRPSVIRGNASEIRALAGHGAGAQGVDAQHGVDEAREAATALALATGAVVAVSGPVDLITDGSACVRVANGSPLFAAVTGAGCALGGVVAAFLAVGDDVLTATTAACLVYAVAGEVAGDAAGQAPPGAAPGPGSFAVRLLDALAAIDAAQLEARARVS